MASSDMSDKVGLPKWRSLLRPDRPKRSFFTGFVIFEVSRASVERSFIALGEGPFSGNLESLSSSAWTERSHGARLAAAIGRAPY